MTMVFEQQARRKLRSRQQGQGWSQIVTIGGCVVLGSPHFHVLVQGFPGGEADEVSSCHHVVRVEGDEERSPPTPFELANTARSATG